VPHDNSFISIPDPSSSDAKVYRSPTNSAGARIYHTGVKQYFLINVVLAETEPGVKALLV
jgi:hypothetical protein